LGLLKVYEFALDRSRVRVRFTIHHQGSKADEGLGDAFVEVHVANAGRRAVQVAGVLLEDGSGSNTIQIAPVGFPVVLQPATAASVRIQIEWLHYDDLAWAGVVDALGRRTGLTKHQLTELKVAGSKLPSTVRKYRRRDDHSVVVKAFQLRDPNVRMEHVPKTTN
jgi:hypothetical protein